MRTTLKAQAIRLIAIFLLICASTTTVKAQIDRIQLHSRKRSIRSMLHRRQ